MKRCLTLALLMLLAAISAAAQTQTAVLPTPPAPADVRRETFEQVWVTVKDKHFDPTLGGLDWNKIHAKYEPRLAEIKTDDDLYPILQSMIGELGQSHFNIVPPSALVEEPGKAGGFGGIGIDLQVIGGEALVTRVEPNSPAEAAGIRPGFAVRSIDRNLAAETLQRLTVRLAPRKETDEMKRLLMSRILLHQIEGPVGSEAVLQLLDEKDQIREFKVPRAEFKGEMSPAFGNFPPQRIAFETKRLEGNIGYLRFNVWVVIPLMEKIRTAMAAMNDASALIIDLRGNPGGIGGMAQGLAGLLTSEQFSLGTMKMRRGEQYFPAFPQERPFKGPVVILTDAGSASTSEIFAAGLQETKRAVVVGERTAGAALPSVFEKLPTGALFQYAIGDFKTPGGVLIEGRGVIPDVPVQLSRGSLLTGKDAQLEAAIYEAKKRIAPTIRKHPTF